MKQLFVPIELARKLKEKGFDERCFAMYTNRYKFGLESPVAISQHEGSSIKGDRNSDFKSTEFEYVTAPIYQQVTDWLRDKHKIYIEMLVEGLDDATPNELYYRTFIWQIGKPKPEVSDDIGCSDYYAILQRTIEEALERI